MSKDPAILFYTSDFLTGTMLMADEQVGQYIRLLCFQHQKGHLSEKDMLRVCPSRDDEVFGKFEVDGEGKFFNEKMEGVIKKRKAYSLSRSRNRLKKDMSNISISHDKDMENENENENIDIVEDKIKIKIGGVGERDFKYIELEILLQQWGTIYFESRPSNYVTPDLSADIESMGYIIMLYEKKFPGQVANQETLSTFFEEVLSVQDKWWKANATPKLLVKKFNEVCGMIEAGDDQKVYTYEEICDMVTKNGQKMSNFKKIDTNKWVRV